MRLTTVATTGTTAATELVLLLLPNDLCVANPAHTSSLVEARVGR